MVLFSRLLQMKIGYFSKLNLLLGFQSMLIALERAHTREMWVRACVCRALLDLWFEAITLSWPWKKCCFPLMTALFPFNFIFPIMITKVQQLIMLYRCSLHIMSLFFPCMQVGWFTFSSVACASVCVVCVIYAPSLFLCLLSWTGIFVFMCVCVREVRSV